MEDIQQKASNKYPVGDILAIQFKFSKKRDYKIEFTENEKQMKEFWSVIEKKNIGDFGDEINLSMGKILRLQENCY